MKPAATRAATARVLADIDAAVRSVERARTAAAVDRVLTTAAPAHGGLMSACAAVLHEESGIAEHYTRCSEDCDDCDNDEHFEAIFSALAESATPGMTVTGPGGESPHPPVELQQPELAPWNVSPHLFPTDPKAH